VIARTLLALALAAVAMQVSAGEPRLETRLASCKIEVVRTATQELLRKPDEPLALFHAALGEFLVGSQEEAAFLFVIARTRSARQAIIKRGDVPQLLAIMTMMAAPIILPVLSENPALTQRVVERARAWDMTAPDPYRHAPTGSAPEMSAKLAAVDEMIGQLPSQVLGNTDINSASVQHAREFNLKAMYADRCGPGTLDALDLKAAEERVRKDAEVFARQHPLVLKHSGGVMNFSQIGPTGVKNRLPFALTFRIEGRSGTVIYAEVQMNPRISATRELASTNPLLVCIAPDTETRRKLSWQNVCKNNPDAIEPE